MNSEQFISNIKKVVRNSAIEDTIENLEDPPGRNISESEQSRSDWFISLSDNEKHNIKSIVAEAVDEALFGFLSVLDGVRVIEDLENKGKLSLIYEGDSSVLLNDPSKISLHDLYNSKE